MHDLTIYYHYLHLFGVFYNSYTLPVFVHFIFSLAIIT
jgi:hypothetical protein